MTTKKKFLRVMDFDTSVGPPLYEFGYWAGTIGRWYKEGLPKIQGVPDDFGPDYAVSGPLCRLSTWVRADDVA